MKDKKFIAIPFQLLILNYSSNSILISSVISYIDFYNKDSKLGRRLILFNIKNSVKSANIFFAPNYFVMISKNSKE